MSQSSPSFLVPKTTSDNNQEIAKKKKFDLN